MYRYLRALSLVSSAFATRPANVTICDFYGSGAFLGNTSTGNVDADQLKAMSELVSYAFTGNNTPNDVNINVPGILNNGTVNGTTVSLLKYFDGSLLSTNRGGKAVSINFLDGGGIAAIPNYVPLMNDDSNQK
jgi:hypothetical protein